jgi:sugar phosphate permease
MRVGTSVHYGWVVVFAGMLCIFAALGFGRFALGMLLPSMGESLGLTYSQMGFISTGNFVGYLLSVLVSGSLAVRFGPRLLIFSSLVLVGISMVLISRTSGFLPILLLYLATGVGSGGANVPMMGLVSAWFSRKKRGSAAGFVVIGSGFAIILAGWLIPFVNRVEGADGWRTNWLLLGCIVLAVAAVCLRLIRNSPSEMGLTPVGSETAPPEASTATRVFIGKGSSTIWGASISFSDIPMLFTRRSS